MKKDEIISLKAKVDNTIPNNTETTDEEKEKTSFYSSYRSKRQSSTSVEKPAFKVSAFVSSLNNTGGNLSFNSSFNTSSLDVSIKRSPFYRGGTTFGGASSYRESSGKRVKLSPVSNRVRTTRTLMKAKPLPHMKRNVVTSQTAKRILSTLGKMSSPVKDSKKVPSSVFSKPALSELVKNQAKLITKAKESTAPPVNVLSQTSKSAKIIQTVKSNPMQNKTDIMKRFDKTSTTSQVSNPFSFSSAKKQTESQPFSKKSDQPISTVPLSTIQQQSSELSKASLKMKREKTSVSHFSINKEPEIVNTMPEITAAIASLPITALPKFNFANKIMNQPKASNIFSPSLNVTPIAKPQEKKIVNSAPPISFDTPEIIKPAFAPKSQQQQSFDFTSPNVINNKRDIDTIASKDFAFSTPVNLAKDNKPDASPAKLSKKQEKITEISPGKLEFKTDESVSKKPDSVSTQPVKSFEMKKFSTFKNQQDNNTWSCPICMIPNNDNCSKCIACGESKPGKLPSTTAEVKPMNTLKKMPIKTLKMNFGKSSDQWECPTCMISNENSKDECVACCTKKPGSTSAPKTFGGSLSKTSEITGFNFSTDTSNVKPVAGFSFATDSSKTSSGGFSFATSSATSSTSSGFTFGPSMKPSKGVVSTSPSTTTASSNGFSFVTSATTTSSSGFSFATTSTSKPSEGFAFNSSSTTTSSSNGFSFGSASTSRPLGEFSFALAPSTTTSSSGFSFATASASKLSDGLAPNTSSASKLSDGLAPTTSSSNGFSFGAPSSTATSSSGFSFTSASSNTNGFSFGSKSQDTEKSALNLSENQAKQALPSIADAAKAGFLKVTEQSDTVPSTNNLFAAPARTPASDTKPDAPSNSLFPQSTTPFGFGAASNAPSSGGFGVSSQKDTNIPAPTFNFGKPSEPAVTAASPFSFGSTPKLEASNQIPAFGSSSTSSNAPAPTFNFGNTAGTQATSLFGSAPAAETLPSASGSLFGSSSSGFGASGNSVFGSAPATFGEGGGSTTESTSTDSVFGGFGAPSSALASGGSIFGAAQSTQPTASFNFGSSSGGSVPSFEVKPSGFNLSSTNSDIQQQAPAAAGSGFSFSSATSFSKPADSKPEAMFGQNPVAPPSNLFSMGQSNTTSQPGNRPKRRAIRRSQKPR